MMAEGKKWRRGHRSMSKCAFVCGNQMKRETDRQNCTSWLVSCSLIRMQISSIEEHLGAFLRHSLPPPRAIATLHFSFHTSHLSFPATLLPLSSFSSCHSKLSSIHPPYSLKWQWRDLHEVFQCGLSSGGGFDWRLCIQMVWTLYFCLSATHKEVLYEWKQWLSCLSKYHQSPASVENWDSNGLAFGLLVQISIEEYHCILAPCPHWIE